MSALPVDWLLDASALEKNLTSLGLPARRLAMIDSLQELAQESARMACFLAGQPGDDALDYDIVEEEMFKGIQAFQATVQTVLHWKDYGDVKQEPLSPWFGAVSSPTPVSTPLSTPVSSRESSPVDSSDGLSQFALYAPDSPKSDAGYHSREEYDLDEDEPLLLDVMSNTLGSHTPLAHGLAIEVGSPLGRQAISRSVSISTVTLEAPTTPSTHAKRARSPGLTPVGLKKPCNYHFDSE